MKNITQLQDLNNNEKNRIFTEGNGKDISNHVKIDNTCNEILEKSYVNSIERNEL